VQVLLVVVVVVVIVVLSFDVDCQVIANPVFASEVLVNPLSIFGDLI
jgi:hypothetical protein